MPQNAPHVLNIVGPGADPTLFAGLHLGPAAILSPGRAFDMALEDAHAPQILAEARRLAAGTALDVNAVPRDGRRKALLMADMDSTVIDCECLDELADMADLKPQIAAITERAMRGELAFEAALKERVRLLRGLPLAALEHTFARRVRLNPGARALVATMRAHGAHTVLVSGGFRFFTRRVAALAGFDADLGNVLLDDGKALTGEVGLPILGREAKVEALERTARERALAPAAILAVGDGANDLLMLARAGLGVAYHAKPLLVQGADAVIAHGDLSALLYLQGYRDDEIVRP